MLRSSAEAEGKSDCSVGPGVGQGLITVQPGGAPLSDGLAGAVGEASSLSVGAVGAGAEMDGDGMGGALPLQAVKERRKTRTSRRLFIKTLLEYRD